MNTDLTHSWQRILHDHAVAGRDWSECEAGLSGIEKLGLYQRIVRELGITGKSTGRHDERTGRLVKMGKGEEEEEEEEEGEGLTRG